MSPWNAKIETKPDVTICSSIGLNKLKTTQTCLLAILLPLGLPLSGYAQTPPPAVDGAIERLKPGEYLWAPEIAPEGPVSIIVSLKTQRAYAYRNGVPIGVSTVSTGKPGHETPVGIFVILQKAIYHKSNLYEDAPMPYMQRLTWDGIAMHAGKLPGYPASHGCIRLPVAFAKLLFSATKLGLTVVITDDPLAPETVSSPPVLESPSTDDYQSPKSFKWQPEKSPSGPVSVVISGRDKRVVVLRNGVEIGSGAVRIDGAVAATEAFILRAVDAEGAHWMRLPLPGTQTGTGEMTSSEHGRVHMSEAFRKAIISILQPGSTLLVTRDSLRSGGTGKRVTVIVAGDE